MGEVVCAGSLCRTGKVSLRLDTVGAESRAFFRVGIADSRLLRFQ